MIRDRARVVPVWIWAIVCGADRGFAGEGDGAGGDSRSALVYAAAPVDNPLKGLVPYRGAARNGFPHSMEFFYISYGDLVKGYDEFDWGPLERALEEIGSRGNQAVFRVYLEYPGRRGSVPRFLLEDGLRLTTWRVRPEDPGSEETETPDYGDANLRRSLRGFIAALGEAYDGDPRIGYATAGLLGLWGEWHDYPREDLFADKVVQTETMDAFEAAFRRTRVLLRYPAGEGHPRLAPNAGRSFGYHDDSFAWATLEEGPNAGWSFARALREAGPAAESKWRTRPIGGEIRPEAWGLVFDERPGDPRIQDFAACVEATRATWLMDSGAFREPAGSARFRRAEELARRMGYEIHARSAAIGRTAEGGIRVSMEVENRGVAPFPYDWRPRWGLLRRAGAGVGADFGEAIAEFPASGRLPEVVPGEAPRVWTDVLNLDGDGEGAIPAGEHLLAVRIPNPMRGGRAVRFANAGCDAETGWLVLGPVRVP